MLEVQNGVANSTVDEAVLFPFDNHSIPFSTGLRLQLIPGKTPYNIPPIVMRSGSPGEPDDEKVIFYGTVIEIDGELRMWYQAQSSQDSARRLGYAVSEDGVHWEKPKLGLVEFNGTRENNIVDLFDGQPVLISCPILYDPEDPDPDRRFKMAIETSLYTNQLAVAYSADGLRWQASPNNPVAPAQETGSVVKLNGCYYVTSQDELGYHGSHFGIARKMVTFASYDFETWTQAPCLGFQRDNIPPRPMAPHHNMSEEAHQGAMLWNRGNVIIGVYDMWHGNPLGEQDRIDMDLGLVVSNDALHYREPIPDFKLIPAAGELEAPLGYGKAVNHAHGPAMVNRGDKTMMWYGMFFGNGIRLATWHRDRLGCFETFDEMLPGEREFFPITRPEPHFISCVMRTDRSPAKVFANAVASPQSPLTVEVLDEQFRPLPGYSGDDCVPLVEDGFRQPVVWKSGDALPSAGAASFRLQVNYGGGVRPEDAKLYALYVADDG
jgi:hypothetical protein